MSTDLFEKLMARPTLTLGGKSYYIVENDRKVAEDQLQNYVDELCAVCTSQPERPKKSSELVGATIDGRLMRWKASTVLTWKIDEASFKGNGQRLAKAREICQEATEDWNKAAKAKSIFEKIHFAPAGKEAAAFTFAYNDFPKDPGLLAVAFFPNDPKGERVVYIGPGTLDGQTRYHPVGIMRHELGHVLGFRHEHIRPESRQHMTKKEKEAAEQWIEGTIGAEVLGEFDGQSVMHYPIRPSEGLGTFDFKLSDKDVEGFGALYAMPYDEKKIREFSL